MADKKVENIQTRNEMLRARLKEAGLDALILNASPSLKYLTGLSFHLSERPVMGIFTVGGGFRIFLPELEISKLDNLPFLFESFVYGEDPSTWQEVLRNAVSGLGKPGSRIGVDDRWIRMLEMRMLYAECEQVEFENAEQITSALRINKDESELALMRKAVQIAEAAFEKLLGQIEAGQTERQIASILTKNLYDQGSGSTLPFAPLVASGPQNSANPHAFPGERVIQDGDLIVIDWGASVDGYFSDITRTIAVGDINADQVEIYEAVLAANQVGRAFGKPGVTCSDLDAAARSVIEEAGFGEYFIHRTGHGLGIEVHEAPFIRFGNQRTLQPGNTFTIEPGVYIPGVSGVRIEDDVVITEDGLKSLTTYPRDLIRV